jgi:hypothetical protein
MMTEIFICVSACISGFASVLWTFIFLITKIFGYGLYYINGNMLSAFIPTIKTYSYSSNEEPCGWIIGWEDGFYIGYLSTIGGMGNQSPIKNLYIFTSKSFYNKYISKNENTNENEISKGSTSKSNEEKNILLFIREGNFYNLDYRPINYKVPKKLLNLKESQSIIIEKILDLYDINTHPYCRILICAKPGFGKSTVAIQLCNALLDIYTKVSLVTTWVPTDPNDSFIRLYNKIKPTKKSPLVILLDEIDETVKNMMEGNIKISDASPMPIEISSKKSWNTFFDSFDIEIYKHVFIIMTSNKHSSYFNNFDLSLLREGRLDIVKDCD